MADSTGTLFFKEKQARLFLILATENKEWYLNDLAKAADVTYVHTSRFISKCEQTGLVATERHGKMKRLILTDKGKAVVNNIQSIIDNIASKPQEANAALPA